MKSTTGISDPSQPAGDPTPNAGLFVLAAFALGEAIDVNDGHLHPLGIAWMCVAICSLAITICSSKRWTWTERLPMRAILAGCLAIQFGQMLIWGMNWRRTAGAPIHLFVLAIAVSGVGAGLIVLLRRPRITGMLLLIVGYALAGAYVIRQMPEPRIDVWYMQQESGSALLHGQDPYEVRYRNIYEPARDFYTPKLCDANGWLTFSLPYPPLTTLFTLPARLLGDVRWSYLAGLELSAVLLAVVVPGRMGQAAAALLLLSPRSLMMIYASWTEPIVILAFAGALGCAVRRPKMFWVALGLLFSAKQYMVLAAPLAILAIPSQMRRRTIMGAFALAAAIALPFFIWDPAAFYRSLVWVQLNTPFRIDSMSFTALLARLTGVQLPSIVGFVAAGATLVWTLRKAPRTPIGFAAATALTLLIFFAFNKQAFCNYHFGVLGMCCGAAAISGRQASKVESAAMHAPLRIAA